MEYFHTTTEFQLAMARLKRLARWQYFKLFIKKMVKEKSTCSNSSERTRTLTLTYLERDAASGDRERDVERVLHDLSGWCRSTPCHTHVFQHMERVQEAEGII